MAGEARLAVVGDADALSVAAHDGVGGQAEVRSFVAGEYPLGFDPHAVVVLGNAPAPETRCPVVRWPAGAGSAVPGRARLVATAGEGLWRRAPWPARESLFEMAPAASADAILVLDLDGEGCGGLARRLEDGGASVEVASRVSARALERASIVACVGAEAGPPRADLTAALAAGRLIVSTPLEPGFGMQAHVDHLSVHNEEGVIRMAGAARAHPEAFAACRAWARLAAERHRASSVYARLALDLASEAGSVA